MDKCKQCGNEYKRIATHWSASNSCDYPDLSDYQLQIVTGLLMGDGCVSAGDDRNGRLKVETISNNYLTFLQKEFNPIGGTVHRTRTAKQSAESSRKSGNNPKANPRDYNDLYSWSFRHPDLERFVRWYDSGRKVWPSDIELTPTVLKHWYVGDGHWNNCGGNNHIVIAMWNEVNEEDKINKIFKSVGLPSPSNYYTGHKQFKAEFTVEQSKELWEYMGKPLPDFEYKWPEVYH